MLVYFRFIFFIISFSEIIKLFEYADAKFLLRRFGNCNPIANDRLKFNITITNVDGKQYIDGSAILTESLDNTIRVNVSVEVLVGSKYVYLISIIERKACDALQKHLGEFIYDLERQAQIIPGICPIPMGRYQVHNALLHFERMTILAALPFGKLRFISLSYDKYNNTAACIIAEVENRL